MLPVSLSKRLWVSFCQVCAEILRLNFSYYLLEDEWVEVIFIRDFFYHHFGIGLVGEGGWAAG